MYGKKSVLGDVCRHFGTFMSTFGAFRGSIGVGSGCVLRSFMVRKVVFHYAKGYLSPYKRWSFAT